MILFIGLGILMWVGCDEKEETAKPELLQLQLVSAFSDNMLLDVNDLTNDVSVTAPIRVKFNNPPSVAIEEHINMIDENGNRVSLVFAMLNDPNTIELSWSPPLKYQQTYKIIFSPFIANDQYEFEGNTIRFRTQPGLLSLLGLKVNGEDLLDQDKRVTGIDSESMIVQAKFDQLINSEALEDNVRLVERNGTPVNIDLALEADRQTVSVTNKSPLKNYHKYRLIIDGDELAVEPFDFQQTEFSFYTRLDSTLKFPLISDNELLTLIQRQTFKYFWDFGHPVSGLTRERNTSGETVTIGGSGFGIMSIIVGMERGFITREEGIERLDKILAFLHGKAERFHGIWSHWLNGTTGEVIDFSPNDNGADLVESAFMAQALITLRQYLDATNPQENALIELINELWDDMEWDWFTQGGQNVLYWHWSPNFGWEKNLAIRGWNEALIVYVLAAGSENYGIDTEIYHSGWARSGGMLNNGSSYYGYTLPLRSDRGGPLFFSHYSFLGLDPRNLSDQYAEYWTQNVTHSLINHRYCIENPKDFVGYSSNLWGLTASDGNAGYSAHSPDNDRGVITPTAAISSLPYTPEESMNAIRHFYYILGDDLWGEYGFYDAFNITEGWVADSYLAIDQGPIIIMIENHRSGLLWDLFMSAPEVSNGLTKLGFTYE